MRKSTQIQYLQSEVQYLKQKVNDIERYQSKDCIIFRNLPFIFNTNVFDDVIYFINNPLEVSMGHRDLVARHELGVVRKPRRPPPIIAKFKSFYLKTRIWGRQKLLRNIRNPHNHESLYMDERLTKVDKEILMYASDLGFRVSTNNSKPQVKITTGENNINFHTIVSKKDIDELSAKSILLEKTRKINQVGNRGLKAPYQIQQWGKYQVLMMFSA